MVRALAGQLESRETLNRWTRHGRVSWLWTRKRGKNRISDPLRTRAIPVRLRGVITTRRYTNTRLPLLVTGKIRVQSIVMLGIIILIF